MTQQLTLKPMIKDMLERAGLEDVYDFPPSAKDCACPIVITNETYERTDLLEDCEYGTAKLEVIAVRETRNEALTAISRIIYALHHAVWEKWSSDAINIREMSVMGVPEDAGRDGSGRCKVQTRISICINLMR